MISPKMTLELNKQLNNELYSAYLYMSMSAHSTYIGLKGFANWFTVQYQEEMMHGLKIYDYINDQGSQVNLMDIGQPPAKFESPLDMFKKTLEHEKFITQCINKLIDLAIEERDHATNAFLQWFITEQVEEEANDNEIIAKLRLAGDNSNALLLIDKDLETRALPPMAAKQI